VRLSQEAAAWRGKWVLMQYTALGWSRRGLPTNVPRVLRKLRGHGARCAVVFHDANPYPGSRLRDRFRRRLQTSYMRRAYDLAELNIFPIPLERVSWLPKFPSKAVFIPIGPNLPEHSSANVKESPGTADAKRIAIFGVTQHDIAYEVSQIQSVVSRARERVGRLELTVLGRGSAEAQTALEKAFSSGDVKLSVLGLLPEGQLVHHLANADVLLFVRGSISIRRGTAIGAIACGLPIVGYEGPETDSLIREAGVNLAPAGDAEALAFALTRVLCDDQLQGELRERSKHAYENHFSWDKIADQFVAVLSNA
jgi:glycosyltransferase involved in cell wall biosynthesis